MKEPTSYLGCTHHLVKGRWEPENPESKERALALWIAKQRDPHAEFMSFLEMEASNDHLCEHGEPVK